MVESDFVSYYRQDQLVYRKKMGFGTNWIGKRQYYASTFIAVSKI